MNPLKLPSKKRPEDTIRDDLITYMEKRGWYIMKMHGSLFQQGFPDLYCTHKLHGVRLIEVKLPEMKGSRWTNAQRDNFPKLSENGTLIWILTAATDWEYRKLFEVQNGKLVDNWFEYYLMKD